MPCIMNAANEIAVAAFLNDEIKFLQIHEMIEKTMDRASFIEHPTLEQYIDTDNEARALTKELIK